MSNAKKRVLIVGTSSKIAEHFIASAPKTYEIFGTHNDRPHEGIDIDHQFQLDVSDDIQLKALTDKLSSQVFDAVLFFVASYAADPDSNEDYLAAYQHDLRLNALSAAMLGRALNFSEGSKMFLFGDAGLTHPKKGYTSYSISKFAVADVARLLAVELAPRTATFCLRLGPTLKDVSKQAGSYYDRSLLRVASPVTGLVNLLHFLIAEDNFNATGCVIDYGGGAYIKRSES